MVNQDQAEANICRDMNLEEETWFSGGMALYQQKRMEDLLKIEPDCNNFRAWYS